VASPNPVPSRIALTAPDPLALARNLLAFQGYPYLLTRMVPVLYHVLLLPADWSPEALREVARTQVRANRLQSCLVLGEDFSVFLDPAGGEYISQMSPQGGLLRTDRLLPPEPLPPSAELRQRHHRLQASLATGPHGGALRGDPMRGGRPATPEEQARLTGRQPNGVPKGLDCCPICGAWRGACLDPRKDFAGHLLPVHCRCENWNRCARCGGPLFRRRLNANAYDPGDWKIWHVPGFCGLSHKCPVPAGQ